MSELETVAKANIGDDLVYRLQWDTNQLWPGEMRMLANSLRRHAAMLDEIAADE